MVIIGAKQTICVIINWLNEWLLVKLNSRVFSLHSLILEEAKCRLQTLDWTWLKLIVVLIFPGVLSMHVPWTVYHQHHGRWILMLISRGIGQTRIKDKKKKKWRQNMKLPVKNIPPPKLGISCSWKYPEYVNFTEIFATFNEWPKFLKGPSKRDLARAGFIHTQIGDKVTCFSCGMTLKNWEPLDDAYNEHLRWAKCCPYAKMVTDGKLLRG